MYIKTGFDYRDYFKKISIERNDVLKLYSHYLDNLGQFLVLAGAEWQFLSYANFTTLDWTDENRDSYVSEGSEFIGNSIKEIGTFWPVTYLLKNDKVSVLEGNHRLLSLKKVGCDRKFLSIKSDFDNRISNKFKFIMMWPSESENDLVLDENIQIIKKVSDDLYEVEITGPFTAYKSLIVYSMFLSELIFRTRPVIEGAPCINDEASFIPWYYNKVRKFTTNNIEEV